MKISIEFDSNNKEELDAVLAVLSASPVGKDEPPKVEQKAKVETKKSETKKSEPEKAKPKKEEPAAETEEVGETYTLDQVRAQVKKYAGIEGKTAAIEKLKEIGKANSLAELDAANYTALYEACALPSEDEIDL